MVGGVVGVVREGGGGSGLALATSSPVPPIFPLALDGAGVGGGGGGDVHRCIIIILGVWRGGTIVAPGAKLKMERARRQHVIYFEYTS